MQLPTVIKATFGEHYWRNICLLFVVVVAPPTVLLADRKIRFDPAKFSEEWLKIWLSGIILVLVLEFIRSRQEERLRAMQISSITVAHLIPHLESLQDLLLRMQVVLTEEAWDDLPGLIESLHREQRGIGRCIEAYKNHLAPTEVEQHALVAEVEHEYWENVEKLTRKVRSTSTVQSLQTEIFEYMRRDVASIIAIIRAEFPEGALS